MAGFNESFGQYVNTLTQVQGTAVGNFMTLARVLHIVQGPNLPGTNTPDTLYKDPTSIGEISFQILNSNQTTTLIGGGNNTAKPFFAAFKQLPLVGELVYLILGPSVDMNTSRGARTLYYLPPFNVWGASHHNAFPDPGNVEVYAGAVNRSYQGSLETAQPINPSVTQSVYFPLTPNFEEKADIKSLRQFTGDVTLEGRWGNSIRFGSTTSDRKENSWSSTGSIGNPITIIRNGQGFTAENIPWIPAVENINRDPSSIYLTQGQKIVIDDIQKNFSLASLQVKLEETQTVVVPIQQQLTSTATTSAEQQDRATKEITNPTTTV